MRVYTSVDDLLSAKVAVVILEELRKAMCLGWGLGLVFHEVSVL